MQRLFVLLFGLLLPLSLVGCPATGSDDDDSSDDDDAADGCDDDDATPQDDCTLPNCTADATTGVATGSLSDDAGGPLRCVSLTVCSDVTCLFGKTDDNGDWCVANLAPGDYVAHNIDHPGENPPVNMRAWASFYDFITIEANTETPLANAQIIPFIPEGDRVAGPWTGETELTFGDVTVGFNGDQLEFPFPAASCPDDLTLGMAEIPPAQYPVNGLMGWTVIGAWAFAPFETRMEDGNGDPVAFDIAVPVGAQDSAAEYSLLFADYDHNISTGTFSEGTGALVGETIEGTVDRLSLVLAVTR